MKNAAHPALKTILIAAARAAEAVDDPDVAEKIVEAVLADFNMSELSRTLQCIDLEHFHLWGARIVRNVVDGEMV